MSNSSEEITAWVVLKAYWKMPGIRFRRKVWDTLVILFMVLTRKNPE